jgi:hypothetical protein
MRLGVSSSGYGMMFEAARGVTFKRYLEQVGPEPCILHEGPASYRRLAANTSQVPRAMEILAAGRAQKHRTSKVAASRRGR